MTHQNSSPNEALFLSLPYLHLFDLLSITRVCRSLRDAVVTDILPWLEITVDRPLNLRITDDVLMEVTSKAQGKLRALSLINCIRITDDGLLRVVARNPSITRLHVPGCTSLSPSGLITVVSQLTKDSDSLQSLTINGIYGIQKEDLNKLCSLINRNRTMQDRNNDKILYHEYKRSPTLPTNRAIDIDVCPKCNEVRMVFDCPKTRCQQRECRGCDACITRCVECGICITVLEEDEEVACEDTLCSGCWLRMSKCSFCHKPYCSQHAGLQQKLPDSTGFLCASCHVNFTLPDFYAHHAT